MAACGALAGVVSGVVSSPVEHVRIRMQLQGSGSDAAYKGSVDAFKVIIRQHGLKGLYQGTGATMWREAIGYGKHNRPLHNMLKARIHAFVQLGTLGRTMPPSATFQSKLEETTT